MRWLSPKSALALRIALVALATGCGSPRWVISQGTATENGTAQSAGDEDAGGSTPAIPDAGPDLNVLFIGNSYTFVNDLPGTLALLAASSHTHPAIRVSSVAVGSATLQSLWQGADARAAVARGGWTHVVLQEQSVTPLSDPSSFFAYASLFAAAARNVGATPTFYETWARADGDAVYSQPWSGGTATAMQNGLFAAYEQAATADAALLAPAGEAWRAIRAQGTIPLFQADGSHPDAAGTYLTACVFYVKLTSHAVPENASVTPGLDGASAAALRAAALTVAAP